MIEQEKNHRLLRDYYHHFLPLNQKGLIDLPLGPCVAVGLLPSPYPSLQAVQHDYLQEHQNLRT